MNVHRNGAVKTRRKSPRPISRPIVTTVDRLVWALALEMADGDPRRIQIIDADTVLVINPPRKVG